VQKDGEGVCGEASYHYAALARAAGMSASDAYAGDFLGMGKLFKRPQATSQEKSHKHNVLERMFTKKTADYDRDDIARVSSKGMEDLEKAANSNVLVTPELMPMVYSDLGTVNGVLPYGRLPQVNLDLYTNGQVGKINTTGPYNASADDINGLTELLERAIPVDAKHMMLVMGEGDVDGHGKNQIARRGGGLYAIASSSNLEASQDCCNVGNYVYVDVHERRKLTHVKGMSGVRGFSEYEFTIVTGQPALEMIKKRKDDIALFWEPAGNGLIAFGATGGNAGGAAYGVGATWLNELFGIHTHKHKPAPGTKLRDHHIILDDLAKGHSQTLEALQAANRLETGNLVVLDTSSECGQGVVMIHAGENAYDFRYGNTKGACNPDVVCFKSCMPSNIDFGKMMLHRGIWAGLGFFANETTRTNYREKTVKEKYGGGRTGEGAGGDSGHGGYGGGSQGGPGGNSGGFGGGGSHGSGGGN